MNRLVGFAGSRRANVSILFAFSLVPMVGLAGLGIDYGIETSAKSKLDNAADAAALAAVVTAKAYVAAHPSDTNVNDSAIAAGLDRAKRAFAVNAGSVAFTTASVPTITLVRSGQTFSSNISYNAVSTAQFGRMFGQATMNVAGTSGARADVPSYIDFYLLVDVSGSMGLPATDAGQTQLKSINHDNSNVEPEGCQFACHFPGYTGYNLALANNIQLRSGAVNSAVCQLLKLAASQQVVNQYRVGIYPFITQMATLSSITTDIHAVQDASDCLSPNPMKFTSLLDTGTTQFYTGNDPSTGTGSGGTYLNTIVPGIQGTISPYGDGTSATKSRPFVFIVTDGLEDTQHYATNQHGTYYYPGSPSTFARYPNAGFDGAHPQAMTPSQCAGLKAAGATISILYVPYIPLTFKSDPYKQNAAANAAVPQLPVALQQCASPGFFRTANEPSDITNALSAMFNQAIQVAHLSK